MELVYNIYELMFGEGVIMKYNRAVLPVLKWVGGKRQILHEIRKYIPARSEITSYYEPFVGGGAVFFDIQPKKAMVNDINSELINLYKIIADDVESLIEELRKYKNESEFFYQIRV